MHSKKTVVVYAGILLLGLLLLAVTRMQRTEVIEMRTPGPTSLYTDPTLPIETRVADLMSYMTLEEKVAQMALVEKNSVHELSDVSKYGLGGVLSGFGGKPDDNSPLGWRSMVLGFIDESKKSRLSIPILYGVDAIHGHSNVPGATIFPHFIGLGATKDDDLVRQIAEITAIELAATGINWSFSPTLDQPRDIRWGRVFESFSDDPDIVSELGQAYIDGLQNTPPLPFIVSTPKHFIGAGAMLWDRSSNRNFRIDQGLTVIDEKVLRTEYLPPFKEAIDAGAMSIMVGLNSWGDDKLAASSYLMTDVLKQELGFDGFVVSDWYGVYEIPGSDYRNTVTAINAGVDMVMLPFDYKTFIGNVLRAVRNGDISEARINDAVRRILNAKFSAGLFHDQRVDVPLGNIGSEKHRLLAREAAARSAVLLRNDGSVLPLRDSVRSIRVAGSAAHNTGKQAGGWTIEWQGVDGNVVPGATSILEGIQSRANSDVAIEFDRDGNFSDMNKADIGIAVVGERPYAEGWGDAEFPILSDEDLNAVLNLQKSSKKLVVIIVSGRPVFITNEIGTWDAVVAAWLPGSEGAGIADALFGDVPFTGTLPLPWPRYAEQLPFNGLGVGTDGSLPLFTRGYRAQ